MEAFSDLKTPAFVFDIQAVRRQLRDLATDSPVQTAADRRVREFYQHTSQLLWIDKCGVDQRADTLLSWLHRVGDMGLSERSFCVADIEHDLQRLRTLQLSAADNASRLAARLEYRLTRACMRYAYGQRYGFVNPFRLFNHLDIEKQDTVRQIVRYRELFAYDMELPAANYDSLVCSHIATGDLSGFLQSTEPADRFYHQLKGMLAEATDEDSRRRIICNMERCRWRLKQPLPEEGKHIVVNIPAFHLYAFGPDSLLDMRVVCGANSTKTPLLVSAIEWMEVNPQWIIPKSILEKDIIRHIGDSAYFARNRYDIYERSTNKPVAVSRFTRQMLLSGNYRVAQQSGSDNSLGRIVFRFRNKFQVFLHYTSNPGAFQRTSRAMSHGCVRVARPFELAQYVLDNPDEWLLDRIRISMDLKPQTDRGKQYLRQHEDKKEHKLIGYVPVKPMVPLYIIYFTLWPDEQGMLQKWPDVYGYDSALLEALTPFL